MGRPAARRLVIQIRRSLGSLAACGIEELELETGEEALAGRVVVGIAKTRTPNACCVRPSPAVGSAVGRTLLMVPLVHTASGLAVPCARCKRACFASLDRTRISARYLRDNA